MFRSQQSTVVIPSLHRKCRGLHTQEERKDETVRMEGGKENNDPEREKSGETTSEGELNSKDGRKVEKEPMQEYGLKMCVGGTIAILAFFTFEMIANKSRTKVKEDLRSLEEGKWVARNTRKANGNSTPHQQMTTKEIVCDWTLTPEGFEALRTLHDAKLKELQKDHEVRGIYQEAEKDWIEHKFPHLQVRPRVEKHQPESGNCRCSSCKSARMLLS